MIAAGDSPSAPGEIITFYSYKGGTGRSMALANVACLLAQTDEGYGGVLMVDWDLEAPGLHRYFADRFERKFSHSSSAALSLQSHPGLIELFEAFRIEIAKLPPTAEEPTPEMQGQLRRAIDLDSFLLDTDIPNLSIMKAGCFDEDYARRVNTFPWEPLYKQAPWLISFFADWLTSRFRYVLIDSRTGITDTSGICTMLLPDKLVVVFTPNQQSLDGVLEMTERATNYRRRSSDVRPLSVFPLASRIELSEPGLRERWRKAEGIGYQPRFETLFKKVWGLSDCNLESYLNEVQIQHASSYAYGEQIAVLSEKSDDRTSLRRAFTSFAERLATLDEPWDATSERTSNAAPAAVDLAESRFAQFTPDGQDTARRLFLQLVRLPLDATRPVAREIPLKSLSAEQQRLIDGLLSSKLFTTREDPDAGTCVSIADEALITHWRRLTEWIRADAVFLNWRDTLDSALISWERHKRGSELLLRGKLLAEATRQMTGRTRDLNLAEYSFIRRSTQVRSRRTVVTGALAALIILSLFVGYALFRRYQNSSSLAQAQAILAQRGLAAAVRAERLVPDSPQIETALRTLLAQTLQPVYLFGRSQIPDQVVFSPDETFVAVHYPGQRIFYQDLSGNQANPNSIPEPVGHQGSALMAVNPDANPSGVSRLRGSDRYANANNIPQPTPYKGNVVMAVSASNGGTIATGTETGQIYLSTPIARSSGSNENGAFDSDSLLLGSSGGSVKSLAFNRDGEYLASVSNSGELRLWSISGRRLVASLASEATQVLFSPSSGSGGYMVTTNQLSLRAWTLSAQPAGSFRATDPITNFCFFPAGNKIAVTHASNQISILSFPALEQEQTINSASPSSALACSSSGSVWVLLSNGICQRIGLDGTTKNWDTPAQGSIWTAISPGGKYIASTLQNGNGTIISSPDPEQAKSYASLKGSALAEAACKKLKPIATVIIDYSNACP